MPDRESDPSAEEIELVARLDAQGARRADDEALGLWYGFGSERQPGHLEAGGVPAGLRAPTAEALAGLATGEELSWRLQEADPEAVDDYALVELFAAWWRLVSWAQAGAARIAGVLASRRSMTVPAPAPGQPDEHAGELKSLSVAAHELAMRVMISRPAAQAMVDVGRAGAGVLWPVGEALRGGLIDLARARAFVHALATVPWQVAVAVQERVLPAAPGRTVRQLRQDIARALVEVDPRDAAERHQRARSRRRVCRPTTLPDGMAGIWAVLPAVDAVALDTALDAAARHARNNGDRRSSDELRADVLASIGHNALATGWIGTPPATAPIAAHTPTADPPDPADSADAADPATTAGAAAAGMGFRLATIGGRPAQIRVVIPLSVLTPSENEPDAELDGTDPPLPAAQPVAELDGYGPITPEVARALALGGTWTRLITDPETGNVRSVGRRRYQPPTELADVVRARDKTCIRPGCSATSQTCDLDHTVPYQEGGHTADWNLAPLCAADHQLKSAGALRIRNVGPGTYDFHTPSGHTYRRHSDGTTTMHQSDHWPDGHYGPDGPNGNDDDPPPF